MRGGDPVVVEWLIHALNYSLVFRVKDGILLAVEEVQKLQHNDFTHHTQDNSQSDSRFSERQ